MFFATGLIEIVKCPRSKIPLEVAKVVVIHMYSISIYGQTQSLLCRLALIYK